MQSIIQYRRLHHRDLGQQSRDISVENGGHNILENGNIEISANGDDSTEPRSWSTFHSFRAVTIVWLLVFTQGWVSTCESGVSKVAAQDLHVSETAQTLAVALFMLGISTGALIAGPISESVGRNPVYLASSLLLLVFTMGSALAPNFGAQIALRFLSGVASSSALSMYGGTLADLFSNDERRSIWAVFSLSPLLGPVFAPVAAGWIEGHIPWRWTLWIALAFAGLAFLLALLFMPETFSPELLRWKAQHLRQVTGDLRFVSRIEIGAPISQRLWENVQRPAAFFTTEPIIIFLGLYLVLIFVINFSFLNGLDFILTNTYGLSEGIKALNFLSIAVGVFIEVALTPLYNRLGRRVHRRQCRAFVSRKDIDADLNSISSQEHSQPPEIPPEIALLRAAIAAPFLAASLFWLGWTNYPSINPASAYAATVVFGYAFAAIFISSYQYIIDSYENYSSSALASITTARYFVSAGMIVATRPMYQGIGVHRSLTVLAGLATVLVPVPWILLRYGASIRKRSPFASSTGE